MRVSVVIPCYNEHATLLELLGRVRRAPVNLHEILLVDDASTDGTRELIRKAVEPDPTGLIRVFYHAQNQGKGAALRTGFGHVSGDVVIIQDADLEYDPQEYPKLLRPIQDDLADVVYGSRFSGGEAHRVVFFRHMLGNRFLTFVSNCFTNINLTDMETCFKVFRREILDRVKLEENRFGIEPELTAKIARLPGCRIYEVGVAYYGRTYFEGKKIGWRDGVRAIYAILKYNLWRR